MTLHDTSLGLKLSLDETAMIRTLQVALATVSTLAPSEGRLVGAS